jgi:Fe-S cluster biogenesis protein NfuA
VLQEGRAPSKERALPVDETEREKVAKICHDILAPLVESDGGEMYLVRIEEDDIHIHLTGTCAGCPGASITGDKVILPALRNAAPNLRIVLTTGIKAPEGSKRV